MVKHNHTRMGLVSVFAELLGKLCYTALMNRFQARTYVMMVAAIAALVALPARAQNPYDDYYDFYEDEPAPPNTAPQAQNPANMGQDDFPPNAGFTSDNDAYYRPPIDYGSSVRSRCNTIGDMPSCGSD